MKRILLSVLYAFLMIVGLLGLFFEGTMFIDRLNGGKMNTRIVWAYDTDKGLFQYAKIISEYVEAGKLDELKNICEESGVKFAVYTKNGSFRGRNMDWPEEGAALTTGYTTDKETYVIRLQISDMISPEVGETVARVWMFFYGSFVKEGALTVISIVLLVFGAMLFVSRGHVMVKYLLALAGLFAGNILLVKSSSRQNTYYLSLCLIVEAIILIAVGAIYISKISNLRKAVKEIADGNINSTVDEKEYPVSLKGFAHDIGRVSESVSLAVNERMKSERLKTELITNISHDIKTPLTSIINFSDLINKDEASEEEKKEYAEHLHKQSVRLKELLESLIEASKAATGAVELHMSPCDVHIILEQCVVEYEHKLNEADITLVESYPEEKLMISADAKFLSRIFENLLTNISKYSMPGSRAYVSATKKEGQVIISFKNMSKDPLNFSMEELTERFVRGDLSRHSEGHGLGLSIVKSLMDLQNGKLLMYAEADLFVAELSFPLLEIAEEETEIKEG